eukprot:3058567-Rhodomonas_salina.1
MLGVPGYPGNREYNNGTTVPGPVQVQAAVVNRNGGPKRSRDWVLEVCSKSGPKAFAVLLPYNLSTLQNRHYPRALAEFLVHTMFVDSVEYGELWRSVLTLTVEHEVATRASNTSAVLSSFQHHGIGPFWVSILPVLKPHGTEFKASGTSFALEKEVRAQRMYFTAQYTPGVVVMASGQERKSSAVLDNRNKQAVEHVAGAPLSAPVQNVQAVEHVARAAPPPPVENVGKVNDEKSIFAAHIPAVQVVVPPVRAAPPTEPVVKTLDVLPTQQSELEKLRKLEEELVLKEIQLRLNKMNGVEKNGGMKLGCGSFAPVPEERDGKSEKQIVEEEKVEAKAKEEARLKEEEARVKEEAEQQQK